MRYARRLKREDPSVFVAVTGCAAQTETALYAKSPDVDLTAGNSHRDLLPEILQNMEKSQGLKVLQSNIFKNPPPLHQSRFAGADSERTRAFLKIQDGCSAFCSFCIIPFARGKSRSFPISHLVKTARRLAQNGAPEIVLTGVHIGDYRDGVQGLADLVERLLKSARVKRLRLSSLEPFDLSDKLLSLFQDERLCPHIHLSAQSAHSKTLSAMRRKYKGSDVQRALSDIARRIPGAFVGMDLIAGFPSETQEDFEETYQVLKSLPWTRLHVFPYSPRPKTYAARKWTGLSREEIMKRAGFLRRLSNARFQNEQERQTGSFKKVIFFNPFRGLSRDYWPISVPQDSSSGNPPHPGALNLPSVEKGMRQKTPHPGEEALVRIQSIGKDGSLTAHLV